MEYGDFVDMASNLVYGLVDRLSEQRLYWLVLDTESGIQSPQHFMNYLLGTLIDDQIPISPNERDTVVLLLQNEKMDLAEAKQFNITEYQPPVIQTNAGERLDHSTFAMLSTELAHRLHGRIDEVDEYMLRQEINDNIPDRRNFVDRLLGPLIRDQLPITPHERDTVIRLMQDQNISLTPVTKFRMLDDEPPSS